MLTSSKTDDANTTEVATELQTFAHQTLLLALSKIISPVLTFVLTILQITIKFLKNDSPQLFRSFKMTALTWHAKLKRKRSRHDDQNRNESTNESNWQRLLLDRPMSEHFSSTYTL